MSGVRDLDKLIAGMDPELQPGVYRFVTCVSPTQTQRRAARMVFEEPEGVTLILAEPDAEGLDGVSPFRARMLTLNVHSALDAVGFLAAVTGELARHGISANCVAGFYHDHLFVPADRAQEALDLLVRLAARSSLRDQGV